ncbi:MAG: MarR family winged helix-turn-helix transcriptional regulator, partial [Janthinobacterium lividum]
PTGEPIGQVVAELEAELADLWQVTRARTRELAQAVHPRLDPTAYPLIAILWRADTLRPSELGVALHLDLSTVSRQISAAERLGLVTRIADPRDARARLVTLSPVARERVSALQSEELRQWQQRLERWGAVDLAELTRLLRLLKQS